MYSEKINNLFASQLLEWELAKVNYSQLETVKTRILDFGDFEIHIQFNPERIRSSAARVDSKSIGARPCFLCPENRPVQQRGVAFEGEFTVLVNPFPVFSRHLTIISDLHTDQRIKAYFGKMLSLARAIPGYVIFYNGPECGASAPDHFHFQAGNKGLMPVEKDFYTGKHTRLLYIKPGMAIWQWTNYLRSIITLKGSDKEKLINIFDHFFNNFSTLQPEKPEPMLNIVAYHSREGWVVHLLPRKLHRPTQFFAEGGDQILISPASVDLGGLIITPREEDFKRIGKDDIADIFSQVCLEENLLPEFFNEII